jgi:hypothetical protein
MSGLGGLAYSNYPKCMVWVETYGDIQILLEDIQRHTNIIGKLFMLFYTNSLFKKI